MEQENLIPICRQSEGSNKRIKIHQDSDLRQKCERSETYNEQQYGGVCEKNYFVVGVEQINQTILRKVIEQTIAATSEKVRCKAVFQLCHYGRQRENEILKGNFSGVVHAERFTNQIIIPKALRTTRRSSKLKLAELWFHPQCRTGKWDRNLGRGPWDVQLHALSL